jgi:hypothetical protein
MFVIDSHGFKEAHPDVELLKEVFINPEIVEVLGEDFSFNEGCLSLPEIREDVVRKSEIILTYTNREAERKTTHFKIFIFIFTFYFLFHFLFFSFHFFLSFALSSPLFSILLFLLLHSPLSILSFFIFYHTLTPHSLLYF